MEKVDICLRDSGGDSGGRRAVSCSQQACEQWGSEWRGRQGWCFTTSPYCVPLLRRGLHSVDVHLPLALHTQVRQNVGALKAVGCPRSSLRRECGWQRGIEAEPGVGSRGLETGSCSGAWAQWTTKGHACM